MSTKSIVSSAQALRQYLKSPKFARNERSCCLIISSAPDPSTEARDADDVSKQLSNFVDRSKFTMSVELGLRSVHSNITAVYPTMKVSEVCCQRAVLQKACLSYQ